MTRQYDTISHSSTGGETGAAADVVELGDPKIMGCAENMMFNVD